MRKELTEAGHDAGPETIAWHLQRHHGHRVSRATISRHLTKAGLITPDPKKKPRSSWIRFEAAMPNQTWQSDFTYRLADGTGVEILTWLDDCTRYALHISAHRRVTTTIVLDTFRETVAQHGKPASTLTDIQSWWRGIRADLSAGGEDRCRPAPARQRYLTEWSAMRLLAC